MPENRGGCRWICQPAPGGAANLPLVWESLASTCAQRQGWEPNAPAMGASCWSRNKAGGVVGRGVLWVWKSRAAIWEFWKHHWGAATSLGGWRVADGPYGMCVGPIANNACWAIGEVAITIALLYISRFINVVGEECWLKTPLRLHSSFYLVWSTLNRYFYTI